MATLAKMDPAESPAKRESILDMGPGVHECWYPVALSSSLEVGKVLSCEIGSARIVVYRGEDGTVRAMSAYCRHMGADLGVGGEVIGNSIRCPFHHWAYGDGGRCNNIPAGDKIPKQANLFHFASREQFGLIWVFFGKTPLYDLQTFEDFDEEKHVARSYEVELSGRLDCEPWMFTLNVFDLVHLRFLHGINIANSQIEQIDPYRRRMSWDADLGNKGVGAWRHEINVYGMNSLRTIGEQGGRLKWYIAASVPSVSLGTRFFLTIITTKDEGADEFLDRQAAMHTTIMNEDVPILNAMRPDNILMVPSDREMMLFIRAAMKYPRTSLEALERSAMLGDVG